MISLPVSKYLRSVFRKESVQVLLNTSKGIYIYIYMGGGGGVKGYGCPHRVSDRCSWLFWKNKTKLETIKKLHPSSNSYCNKVIYDLSACLHVLA